MRILRLIENMTLGRNAVGIPYRVHAWGRLATSAENSDSKTDAGRIQKESGKESSRHQKRH